MSNKKCLACLLLCAALAFGGCAQSEAAREMTVVFYDVGKADAILILTENSAVLIDAGKNKDGKAVAEDLAARGIDRLDRMIITHFDKDHVGGADQVLEAVSVGAVYEPAYEKDSKQLIQYREALAGAGLTAQALNENFTFTLDGVTYEIDVANETFYGADEENDFSLVVRATLGETAFLFAGDAEAPRLQELLAEGNLRANVLKVPHHGVYETLSGAFFEAVGAQYAVITSSAEEPEDEAVISLLEGGGTRVLLTREGTVTIRSDGESLRVEE